MDSLEEVLSHLDPSTPWGDSFRRRYLDFSPIAELLDAADPRLAAAEQDVWLQGVSDLQAIGTRVVGEGSVLGQILQAQANGHLGRADTAELEALDARAADLAVDLRTLREAAYGVWSQIEQP